MKSIFVSAGVAFAIDQASKLGVLHGLGLLPGDRVDVLPPYLVFILGQNTGINFGLFDGGSDVMRWILVALAVAVSAWLLVWGRRGLPRPIARLSAGLIIGGALGNAFDRLIYGWVVDFLNMSCCGIQNPYVFNLADVAIFLGAFGLIFFADPPKREIG